MSSDQGATVPFILSMEVDDENENESDYRLRVGSKVKYLKIAPATFDRDTLSFPLAALPSLPFEDNSWTLARISRDTTSGKLETSLSIQRLAGVQNVWHSVNINVLDLKRVEQLTGATFEAMLSKPTTSTTTIHPPSLPTNIIAKTARFEWEIPRIEQETRAYQLLQQQDPELAPQFLGHIHEEGRVMGFLLEKLDGRRHASISDLSDCEAALKRLHSLGLSHGDVNRYNFLVGENDVKLIDFERFQERVTEELYSKELESLRMELTDESGRGAGFIFGDEEV